jgi:biotin carboxylase
MLSRRVLVVGTTADYIDLIRRRHPGRALFVTDPAERARATEEAPAEAEEVLCDLTDSAGAADALRDHAHRHGIVADGVACFDCESLALASDLAQGMGLPFPSPRAVSVSRNKFLSKSLWRESGVPCPKAAVAREASEVSAFMDRLGAPVILKPLTGSGSELVFRCTDREEGRSAFETIRRGLSERNGSRMYRQAPACFEGLDPLRDVVLEQAVTGPEYSCDFLLDNGTLEIIRTARKIPLPGGQIGIAAAYVLPAPLPAAVSAEDFRDRLHRAARALGLERALCMVDFIVQEKEAYLLELTPRPGGDCLPWLIRQSSGLDMLGLALDFAEGNEPPLPDEASWNPLVGLRMFAETAGVLARIDARAIESDPRVREVLIKRRPGHRVALPPEDYDSRLLGHVIFKPSGETTLEEECAELAAGMVVEMEDRP